MVGVDIYNALNSLAILTYNNTFVPGGTWLQPQTILTARMVKFSAEFTFWFNRRNGRSGVQTRSVSPFLRCFRVRC